MHDTQGARRLLAGLKYFVPRLQKIWADAAYRGHELADWCKAQGEWELDVVECTPGVRGFAVLPKRWIVERTFGWRSRTRRMSKDDERKVQTSETLIEVAMIRLLIARQGWGAGRDGSQPRFERPTGTETNDPALSWHVPGQPTRPESSRMSC